MLRASIITLLAATTSAYALRMPLNTARMPLNTAGAPAATMVAPAPSSAMETWELCLADASVEEDVQDCMSRMDDEREKRESRQQENQHELELCILSAENEDAVQLCMQMYDEAE